MKKGLTSLLLLIVITMIPSISLASEIEKPLDSLGLTDTIGELAGAVKAGSNKSGSNEATGVGNVVKASQVQKSNQLLGVELDLPVVGKVNLGLNAGGGNDSSSNQPAAQSNGLLDLEISDSNVLGDVKVEVLNRSNGESVTGGLVSVDAATPIVDLHLGVGNSTKEENPIVAEPVEETNLESEVTQPVNKPSQPNAPSQPTLPSSPVNQSENKEKTESSEGSLQQAKGDDQTLETTVDILDQIDLGHDGKESGTLSKADFLTDDNTAESFSTAVPMQSPFSPEELEELKTVLSHLKDDESLQALSPSGSMSTAGSAGSGSAGSSNANAGLGIAALLSSDCLCEIELSNQMSKQQIELSDQWRKPPPIDPPQASFFLYA